MTISTNYDRTIGADILRLLLYIARYSYSDINGKVPPVLYTNDLHVDVDT